MVLISRIFTLLPRALRDQIQSEFWHGRIRSAPCWNCRLSSSQSKEREKRCHIRLVRWVLCLCTWRRNAGESNWRFFSVKVDELLVVNNSIKYPSSVELKRVNVCTNRTTRPILWLSLKIKSQRADIFVLKLPILFAGRYIKVRKWKKDF